MKSTLAPESAEILSVITRFGEALNRHDIRTVSSFFDDNVVFTGPAGTTTGKAAVTERFQLMYSGRFRNATNTMQVTGVQMLTSSTAMIAAWCIAAGIVRSNGDALGDLKSHVSTTLVNRGGRWLIASQTIVNETATPQAIDEVSKIA